MPRLNELPGEPGIHIVVLSKSEIVFDLGKLAGHEDRPELPRKEVIQPQVPLRLPCYDFTPITNHTLGACVPCGLARRLLVQPAFVM